MADQTIPTIKNLRGNIGIGTASPSYKLEVAGETLLDAPNGSTHSLRLGRADNANKWFFNHAGNDLRIYNAAGSGYDIMLGVNSGGSAQDNKVGIGTASPSTPLHVKGNIRAEASGSTAFADLKSSQIYASGTYDLIVGTNNPLFFRTNDTRRMTILGGGNVGIGTTSPVSKLTVESSANALADVDEPENHHLLLRNPANDTTEGVGMGFLVSALTVDVGASILCKRVGPNAQSELQFWNKQNTTSDGVITQSMTIAEDGNLGIGVTDPSFKLDVGTATGGAIARFKDTDSSHEGIIIQGDTNGGSITNAAGFSKEVIYLQNSLNAIRLYTNGGERVRIASNGLTTFYGTGGGALTIGSHIHLGDNQQLRLGSDPDLIMYHEPSGGHSYIDNSTGDLFIRNNSNDCVIIGHNANKGLIYCPDGRVELRFNDSKTFETTANGVKVTGDILAYTASGQYFELDHSDNSLKLSDNVKLKIGTGMDLQIYHNSSDNNNFIESYNGRNLMISANGISLKSAAGENMITATGDGAVDLYYDNSKKFETTSAGVTITGDVSIPVAKKLYFGGGSHTYISEDIDDRLRFFTGGAEFMRFTEDTSDTINFYTDATFAGDVVVTGGLTINGTTTTIDTTNLLVEDKNIVIGNVDTPSDSTADGGGITLKGASDYTIRWADGTNSWHFNQGITVGVDGTGHDVVFYGDTSDRYLTWDQSADRLNLRDHVELTLGTHNDLRLWYNNVRGRIAYTGGNEFQISAINDLAIGFNDGTGAYGETAIVCYKNGAVKIRHDNSQKFTTDTGGITVTGKMTSDTITTAGNLELFQSGNNNYISSVNTGSHLLIRNTGGANVELLVNTSEKGVIAKPNGAVELYHDNGHRLSTTVDGISLHGNGYVDLPDNGRLRLGTNNDMMFYHNGSSLSILDFQNHDGLIRNLTNDKLFIFQTTSGGTQYEILRLGGSGVDARFSQHVSIGSSGTPKDLTTYGSTSARYMKWDGSEDRLNLRDNTKFSIGNSNDLQLEFNGTHGYIKNNVGGSLYIQTANTIQLENSSGQDMLTAASGGAVRLFYGGSSTAKLETTSSGVSVTGLTINGSPQAGEVRFTRSGINNSTYTMLCTVAGNNLASIIDMTITGTSNSVVLNSSFEILVNHYQDIHVKSVSGDYKEVTLRITSDNNEDFSIEAKHNGSTTTTIEVCIFPRAGETITPTTTDPNYTGAEYVHTATEGFRFGGTDGTTESSNLIVDGKIGIGTASPTDNLEVQNSVGNPMIHLRPDAASTALNPIIMYRNQLNGSANYMLCQATNTFFGTYNGGTPTDESEMIRLAPSSSDAPSVRVGDSGSTAAYLQVGGNIKLLNNGDSYITGGDVGIGTTTPSRTLHVYDSAGPTIKFERSSNSNLEFTFGTTNTSIIGSGEIQFRANGGSTNKFIINNSQIQSNAKLLVNTNSGIDVHTGDTGTIIQSGNSSATSTPDQFFLKHNLGNVEIGNERGDIKITKGMLNPLFSDQGGGLDQEAMRWSYSPSPSNYYLSLDTEIPAGGVVRYHWNMKNNGTAYDDVMVFDRGNVCIGNTNASAKLDIRQDSGTAIRCEDGSGGYFVVNQGGATGIGTTSPSCKLDVAGDKILLQKLTGNDAFIQCKTVAGAGAYFNCTSGSSANFVGYELGTNWFMGQYGSANFTIFDGTKNGGTAALVIADSTRYLGINTTPTSPLHLSTAAVSLSGYPITSMTTTIATTNIGAKLSFTGGNNANNSILGGISMGNTGEEFAGMYAMDGGSGGATHLGLFAGTSSAITEGIRILSNGAVAIKTNAVNSGITLQVNGHIYNHTGQIFAKKINADYFSTTQSAEITSGANGTVRLKTSSNVQLEASNQGFVQLSHTASTGGGKFLTRRYSGNDYLNVFSSEYSSGALCLGYGAAGKSGAAGFVSTYDNFAGHKTILKINHNGINVLTTGTSQTDTVDADLSMTERFRVQVDKAYFATGNVGIGATSPTSKLEVSSSGAHGINISQDTGNSVLSGRLFLSTGTTNQACTLFNNGGTLRFATGAHIGNSSGSTRMTLLADGKLGIGTTSPLGTVHIFTADAGAAIATNTSHDDLIIENGGNCGIQLSGPANSYQYLAFGDTASANQGYVRYYHTDNRMDLRAGGTDTLSLVGGNVGIGTTSPNYLLDVEKAGASMRVYNLTDNGNTDIHIRTVGTTGQSRIFFGDTADHNTGAITYRHNGNSLSFKTNDAEAVRINSSGQVGIGTTSPQQELDVDGVIKQKVYTVSNLPSASSSTIGARAFVSDSYYPFSSSYLGSQISGGGSNFSPVYSDGSYWYMG